MTRYSEHPHSKYYNLIGQCPHCGRSMGLCMGTCQVKPKFTPLPETVHEHVAKIIKYVMDTKDDVDKMPDWKKKYLGIKTMTTDHEKNAVIAEALGWRLEESDLLPRHSFYRFPMWWIRPVYKTTHAHPPDYHLDLAAIVDAAHELGIRWWLSYDYANYRKNNGLILVKGVVLAEVGPDADSKSLALALRDAAYEILMERKTE